MFEHVTDHASRAVGRLLTQFRDSAQFKGILNTLSAEIQAIEDAIWQLYAVRDLDNATGATLDKLARLVGAPDRNAVRTPAAYPGSDDQLREIVKLQILVNKSTGIDADLYAIISHIRTDGGATWIVRHGAPATWALGDVGNPAGEYTHSTETVIEALNDTAGDDIKIADTIAPDDARYFASLFKQVAPAGTRIIFRYRRTSTGDAFRFTGATGAGDRAGFGIGKLFNALDK